MLRKFFTKKPPQPYTPEDLQRIGQQLTAAYQRLEEIQALPPEEIERIWTEKDRS